MAPSSEKQPAAKRGFIPPQNAEEQMLMRRVEELCKQVQYGHRPRNTDFLSDRQQQLAQAAMNRCGSDCRILWDGGYDGAERKMLTLLPEGMEYQQPFCGLRLCPITSNAHLQHRDCLGAILGLGLDRKSIGDILLQEDGSSVVFCTFPAADLITQELAQIGKETVTVEPYEQLQTLALQATLQTATVASLRVDAVLAAMLHTSREKAVQLIRAGKLEINHLPVTAAHMQVYEQDVFTVRGVGRFRLEQIGGKSRKDRIFIQYYQY